MDHDNTKSTSGGKELSLIMGGHRLEFVFGSALWQ